MDAEPISLNLDPDQLRTAAAHVADRLRQTFSRSSRTRGDALVASGSLKGRLEGEDFEATLDDGSEPIRVRLTLPLYGNGTRYTHCSCRKPQLVGDEPRCAHVWACYQGLAAALAARDLQSQSLPGWDGVFAAMDAIIEPSANAPASPLEQDEAGKASTRMAWRVVTAAERLSVYPCRERRRGDGWHEESRLPWEATDAVSQLQDLIGNDAVRIAVSEAPVAILEGAIGLSVRPEGKGIRVTAQINGLSPSRQWIFPGRAYAAWTQEDGHRIYIARCNLATTDFLQQLARVPEPLPQTQQGRLLPYLAQLEANLELKLEESMLSGASAPASGRLYMRLSPLVPQGIKAELLVRPAEIGAYFPAGMGPEAVLDPRDPTRPGKVWRDLEDECQRGHELAAALGLKPSAGATGPTWFLRQDEAALALISGLSRQKDVIVEWPKSTPNPYEFEEPLRDQALRLKIGEGRDWFGLEGRVDIAGESLALSTLLAAVDKNQRYLRLSKGKWVEVTAWFERRLLQLAAHLQEDEAGELRIGLASLPQVAEDAVVEQGSEAWWRAHRSFRTAQSAEIKLPPGLKVDLRPYQLEGFQWLCRLASWGMGACLADDMGLGKTIQTLAALLYLAPRGPSLVLAPTSVGPGWEREALRVTPGLRPLMYRDSDRDRVLSTLGAGDLLICSYGLAQRDASKLVQVAWNVLVLDEAQAIKNAETQTARAVFALPAQWRLALSGTPLENNLSELWSLFHTLSPGMFGSWEAFKRSFALPIQRFGYEGSRQALGRRMQPYLLRRLKKDHLHELPPKTEISVDVHLGPEERQLYEAVRLKALGALEQSGDSAAKQSQTVLAALMKLRQIACHPRLMNPAWTGGSAKLAAFVEICRRLRENGHKALVFSQFTSHLDILSEALLSLGATVLRIDGATPSPRRAEVVEAFQAGRAEFCLISIKAGGTGLTLTMADYVLHMDPWWNPAVEDQATDRAHRLGQSRPLTVYRFIAVGTVEATIMKLHESKRQLVASVLQDAIAVLRG